jgi:predicted nucleic acid-binding protein
LRAALGDSPAAAAWLAERRKRREPLIGSKLLDTEARRVVLNRTLAGVLDGEIDLDGHLGVFHMVRLDNDLADEAAAIKQPLRAADAIHLASALRLGAGEVAVVTHDAQMATAAANLGFAVVDPVTDDPRCAAVA